MAGGVPLVAHTECTVAPWNPRFQGVSLSELLSYM